MELIKYAITKIVLGMEIDEVKALISKARKIYVYSYITISEGFWFKTSKKEVIKILDHNKWWLNDEYTDHYIIVRLDKRKNLWIG